MTRPPSRSTLKLPPKSADGAEASDPRLPPRKPVRSGARPPKPTAGQHAQRRAAETARSAQETERKTWKPRPPAREAGQSVAAEPRRSTPPRAEKPQRERAPAPVREIAAEGHAVPRPPRAPEDRPKKTYPPRGIARSTGARALPPLRREGNLPPADRQQHETSTSQPASGRQERAHEMKRSPARPETHRAPSDMARPAPTMAEPTRHASFNEPPRLAKRLCELFGCSRREADEWIENGWVRVDGQVVTALGTRAHPKARIELAEAAHQHTAESVTIILNKPAGIACSTTEPGQQSALQLIGEANRWTEDDTPLTFKATHLRRLALAGRLDTDASGMLVFTQEGSVARRITGDETRLEKEYLVRIEGELSADGLRRLNIGLTLDDIKLKRAQVSWQNERQLRFVLHENRPEQIQRMCETVGVRAVDIKRLRIGSVSLGKLPAGKWRYLRPNERF